MKQIEKEIRSMRRIMIIITLTIVIITGAILNLTVVATNDGKMPVKTDNYLYSEKHFGFQEDEEINNHFLSDRFGISRFRFSLGDLFMVLPALFILVNIFIMEKERYNERRTNKRTKERTIKYKNK